MLFFFLSMLETPDEKQRFAQLYEANRHRMFGVALGVLRDEYLAEDAVNQAFLKLIRRFNKCEDYSRDQMRNYLVIIVRNAAIDMYNDRRKMAEVPFDEGREMDGGYEDEALGAQMDYAELLEAMERLPEIYGEALYLAYHLGLSTSEIAGSLNLSVSAVKLRLMRARAKLRATLEGVDET